MVEKDIHALGMQLNNLADNVLKIETFRTPTHKDIDTQIIMRIEHDRVVTNLRENIYSAIRMLKECKSDEYLK